MASSSRISTAFWFLAACCCRSLKHTAAAAAAAAATIDGGGSDEQADIIGGSPAALGAYGFYGLTDPILTGFCGSTLIHEDVAVTAAHCFTVWEAGRNGVCIGGIQDDCSDAMDRITVEQLYIHPDFDPDTLENDIMLLKLARPSSAPVALWNANATVPESKSLAIAIGLGRSDPEKNVYPETLLEVTMNIGERETCDRFPVYTKDMICAFGTGESGICRGDS